MYLQQSLSSICMSDERRLLSTIERMVPRRFTVGCLVMSCVTPSTAVDYKSECASLTQLLEDERAKRGVLKQEVVTLSETLAEYKSSSIQLEKKLGQVEHARNTGTNALVCTDLCGSLLQSAFVLTPVLLLNYVLRGPRIGRGARVAAESRTEAAAGQRTGIQCMVDGLRNLGILSIPRFSRR